MWIHCETHSSFRDVLLPLRLEDFIQGDQLILIEMEQVVCAIRRCCKSETILDLGFVGDVCWLKNVSKLSLEIFWEIPGSHLDVCPNEKISERTILRA